MIEQKTEILAKVMRANIVESVHNGHVVVVDKEGKVLKAFGDPKYFTFIRSAAKPLQAIPVLERGAAEYFNLTGEEIALMTASHNGEIEHEEVGRSILDKLGLKEDNLACGVHPPHYKPREKELYWQQKEPGPLHCNCSGKHLGMLALAKKLGFNLEGYTELTHPVQQIMLETIAKYSGINPENFKTGTDGCGVPVFAMPLKNMALAYAQLMWEYKRKDSVKKVVDSMLSFPHLVAGRERLCTDLMRETKGKLIGKVGTEGIYCIGLMEEDIGIAIKIADGNPRALGPVVIETLVQLGVLSSEEKKNLSTWHQLELKNHRDEVVGRIIPSFKLI